MDVVVGVLAVGVGVGIIIYAEKSKKIFKENEMKENFLKKAFKDMKENAKAQHEVDKANFAAAKAEAKANFEENRGSNTFKKAKENAKESWGYAKLTPAQKQELMRQNQKAEIEAARIREEDAKMRIAEAKNARKK